MTPTVKKIILPAAVFVASLSLLMLGDTVMLDFTKRALGKTLEFLPYVVGVLTWLSAAFLANRLINALFWDLFVTKATGAPVPRLIVQISNFLVYLLAITGIVGVVFERSVTALLTTSGAMGIVLGFAVRNLILDVFSGLSINIERPFSVGEYVQIHVRGVPNVFGRVEEVNWRTTRLLTPENHIQVIPNSVLGEAVISNYSRPTPIGEFEYAVTLDATVDTERALRVLEAGVREAVLAGGPLADPEPVVRTTGIDEHGVRYKLKYFIDPRKGGPGKIRQKVLEHVLAHLRKAGISTAHLKQEILQADLPVRNFDHDTDRVLLLARVGLFHAMTEAELQSLATNMTLQRFQKGETIIEQGQHLDSMFLLVEGVLETHVPVDGSDVKGMVGHYAPGDVFGEMSLLIGAPQPAEVVASSDAVAFRIDKANVGALLQNRPEIAEELSASIAERQDLMQVRLDEIALEMKRERGQTEKKQFVAALAGQIRDFFKIGFVDRVSHMFQRMAGNNPHETVMNGTMAACALVAAADGNIDAEERNYVRGVFGSIGLLDHIEEAAGMAAFDKCVSMLADDPDDGAKMLFEMIVPLADNPEVGNIIVSICQALTAADGHIEPDEIVRLREICKVLAVRDITVDMHEGDVDPAAAETASPD